MKSLSVALKDFRILLKDRGAMIMSFLLPIVLIFVWNIPQLAGESEEASQIGLPVVNLDEGEISREFVAGLNTSGAVQAQPYDGEEALALLEEGEIKWLLEIPPDFSSMSLDHPVQLRLLVHPDADQVEAQSVTMAVNGVANSMAMQSQLLASFEHMGAMMEPLPEEVQVFDTDLAVAQAQSQFESSKTRSLVTIDVIAPQVGSSPVEFTGTNIVVPGFTVLFVFLTAQNAALSIFQEKKQGSFRRLLAAPIGRPALLAGKMLPSLVVTLAQIIVIFAVGRFVMPLIGLDPLTLGNDPLALILLSVLLAVCSTSLGLLIAALTHSEAQASGLGTIVLWVMAALGGSFWPTYLMSGPLQTLSMVAPHSWALRAFNGLLIYGQGLAGVATEMAVLLAFTAVFFVIGLWRFDFD
jgi:ABC-2 type transport system permease protein